MVNFIFEWLLALQKKQNNSDIVTTVDMSDVMKSSTLSISDDGIDLIKRFEGFSSTPYLCPAGKWTIGYGSTHGVSPEHDNMNEEEASDLLRWQVEQYEDAVRYLVTVPLNQHQFDALVSFTYNLGRGALGSSTLLRKLNARNYSGAAREFRRWVYAGKRKLNGLVRRRNEEAALFTKE